MGKISGLRLKVLVTKQLRFTLNICPVNSD